MLRGRIHAPAVLPQYLLDRRLCDPQKKLPWRESKVGGPGGEESLYWANISMMKRNKRQKKTDIETLCWTLYCTQELNRLVSISTKHVRTSTFIK
jgi:hypothetical protein